MTVPMTTDPVQRKTGAAPDTPATPQTGAAPDGRRAALRSRTQSEILDAAAELVTEQGADALNLSELAARAGFGNAASLYRYYPSKKAILGALMRRGLERLEEHLSVIPADLPPEEQLVEFCLAYVEYARAHPGERAVLLTTTAGIAPEDRTASLPEAFVHRVFGLIAAVMGESGVAGEDAESIEAEAQSRASRAKISPMGTASPREGDVFAMLHAAWALAQGMAEYDRLYAEPERGVLRSRHRAVFRAYVEGSKTVWTAR